MAPRARSPSPAQHDLLASTLALSLLWAAAGLEQMVKGRPLDRKFNVANAKSGTPARVECTQFVIPSR
jgi:hypothetical protein